MCTWLFVPLPLGQWTINRCYCCGGEKKRAQSHLRSNTNTVSPFPLLVCLFNLLLPQTCFGLQCIPLSNWSKLSPASFYVNTAECGLEHQKALVRLNIGCKNDHHHIYICTAIQPQVHKLLIWSAQKACYLLLSFQPCKQMN